MAIRCIADDSAADHGHKRCDSPPHALFSQALCVPDVTASQPSSEVPARPTSPCLLLALRRRAARSRELEGALRHVSANARTMVSRSAVIVVGAKRAMSNAASTPQAPCGQISIARSILSASTCAVHPSSHMDWCLSELRIRIFSRTIPKCFSRTV